VLYNTGYPSSLSAWPGLGSTIENFDIFVQIRSLCSAIERIYTVGIDQSDKSTSVYRRCQAASSLPRVVALCHFGLGASNFVASTLISHSFGVHNIQPTPERRKVVDHIIWAIQKEWGRWRRTPTATDDDDNDGRRSIRPRRIRQSQRKQKNIVPLFTPLPHLGARVVFNARRSIPGDGNSITAS